MVFMTKRYGRNAAAGARLTSTCEQCGGRMNLTLVVPAPAGQQEYADYLCENCATVKTVPLEKSVA
jgi:hypothetical protein